MDSNKLFLLLMVDLNAAFDTIDHRMITTRQLQLISFRGNILQRFKPFLSKETFAATNKDQSPSDF